MKKLLTIFTFVLFASQMFAQLPDGADAPNFTSKDLNGKSWTLYDILETGRTVIMDVSATWCGPCWSYHNSKALETVWEEHGPEGDGTMMVLFVEGDGATTTPCLYGPTNCVGGTQGNWVAGTPYPIFDDAAINNKYDVNYFPTVYMITPDKKVYENGQISAAAHWNIAKNHIGNIAARSAKINNLVTNAYSSEFCTAQTAKPQATFLYTGTEHLTQATVELRWKGQTIQTKNYSTDMKAFEELQVKFDEMQITEPGLLEVMVTKMNDQAVDGGGVASFEFKPAIPAYKAPKVRFQITTDNSGKDLYWQIEDDAKNILAKGGNEAVGINGGGQFPTGAPADPTAYANFKTISTDFDAPASGCFTVRVVDGVGNGMVAGRWRLFNSDDLNNPFYTGIAGTWKVTDSHTFAEYQASGTNDVSAFAGVQVFPNPTNDLLNVDFNLNQSQEVNVFITNALGATVLNHTQQVFGVGENRETIPVASLPNGLYFINLKTDKGTLVQKFTKI